MTNTETITASVESIRNEATLEQGSFSRRRAQIQNDPALSPEGREQAITDHQDTSKLKLKELRDKEITTLTEHKNALERSLFGATYMTSADAISYRDALDRANALSNSEDALKRYQQAVLSNDETLKRAIAQRAVQDGWNNIIDTHFTDAAQNKAETLRAYKLVSKLLNPSEAGFNRALAYSI